MAKERAKLDLLVWDGDKAEHWQLSSGPWIMVGAAKDAGDIPSGGSTGKPCAKLGVHLCVSLFTLCLSYLLRPKQ